MDLRLRTGSTRVATEAQVRAMVGFPREGRDEEFYQRISGLIGKVYSGGGLPSTDITTLVEAWNAKNDALAKRREAAVAQSTADREAGIVTYEAIEEHLADPNWRNMDQIAKALGLRRHRQRVRDATEPQCGTHQRPGHRWTIRAARLRCPIWPLGRDT